MVETLDHDAQYLEDGISNCLVLCHILVLEQLVAAVSNQTARHKLSHVSSMSTKFKLETSLTESLSSARDNKKHPYSDPEPDRHQNLSNGSLGHGPPIQKISSKSVHNFWRYLVTNT